MNMDYNADVALRTRLHTLLSLVGIVGGCLDTSSILCPKLMQPSTPNRNQSWGSLAGMWLQGDIRATAVNVVRPNLRERAGTRAAALGPEHSCCWGLCALMTAGSLHTRVAEGWLGGVGSVAEPRVTSAVGRFGGNPDMSKRGCDVKAE